MADIQKKSFNSPDETTNPGEKLKVEVVTAGDIKIQKVTAEPGWKWSEYLKPVVKTESCEKHHLLYVISGKLAARMNDGKEEETEDSARPGASVHLLRCRWHNVQRIAYAVK